jgi:tetratricopeptide (TPR) repeat protein
MDRDVGRVAAAHASLAHAYAWAGLLNESLEASAVALRDVEHIDAFDQEFFGFNIKHWVLGIRARVLIRLGRLDDAAACLAEMLDVESVSSQQPVPGMSRIGFLELALFNEDAALAHQHGEEVSRIGDKYAAAPYVQAFVHGYRGWAMTLTGNHDGAVAAVDDALKLVRSSGAAREYETEVLAAMAECRLKMGDFAQAREHAHEAVAMARARSTRVAECRALISRGQAVLALGEPDARTQAEEDFARAEELIRLTGAIVCARQLERARAFSAARAA